MKVMTFLLFGSLVAITYGTPEDDYVNAHYYDLIDSAKLFKKFVKDYKKIYKDERDKQHRFDVFKTNLEFLNKLKREYPKMFSGAGIGADADQTFEYIY
ncbi:hypothetical protein NE865_02376 [Phthorimaea operculella]|nr:hypothetical protein NE865_02376 [Phthorimaea operculella]